MASISKSEKRVGGKKRRKKKRDAVTGTVDVEEFLHRHEAEIYRTGLTLKQY